jgi:hypothetical protein
MIFLFSSFGIIFFIFGLHFNKKTSRLFIVLFGKKKENQAHRYGTILIINFSKGFSSYFFVEKNNHAVAVGDLDF